MNLRIGLFNSLAVLACILQLAILVRMYRSNLRHELRMFFAYTVFALCRGISMTAVLNYFGFRSPEYFIGYWLGFLVDTTLTFFIIHEIYAKVLYRHEGLRILSSMIFRWAFGLLVLMSIANALATPAADRDWMYSGILLFDRGSIMVEFGLIALLFVFARTLALNWRECVFGIAVGLCFYCATDLVVVTLRTHYRNDAAVFFSVAQPSLNVIMLGIWTGYIYRSDRARNFISSVRNPNLDAWNQAVLQFLNR